MTLKSIIGNNRNESVELAEVELPDTVENKTVMCPYCQSRFADKEELSNHIDRLHLGSGLLEGDLRQVVSNYPVWRYLTIHNIAFFDIKL